MRGWASRVKCFADGGAAVWGSGPCGVPEYHRLERTSRKAKPTSTAPWAAMYLLPWGVAQLQ